MAHDPVVRTLFNAARRYCIDRIEPFVAPYLAGEGAGELSERESSDLSILSAILEDIERAVPEDFSRESNVRDYLLAAGKKATVLNYRTERRGAEYHAVYFEPEWTAEERANIEVLRAAYLAYITDLTVSQALKVAPVLYRHVMNEADRRRVREKLAERRGVNPRRHYWYPLHLDKLPPDILAFQESWFHVEVGVEVLQDIVVRRGITRIWEVTESGFDTEYELDPRLWSFTPGLEMYWSSPELDWLVYTSHESSITFAGDWLIAGIKQAWPNWKQRIYQSWDYERPPNW